MADAQQVAAGLKTAIYRLGLDAAASSVAARRGATGVAGELDRQAIAARLEAAAGGDLASLSRVCAEIRRDAEAYPAAVVEVLGGPETTFLRSPTLDPIPRRAIGRRPSPAPDGLSILRGTEFFRS